VQVKGLEGLRHDAGEKRWHWCSWKCPFPPEKFLDMSPQFGEKNPPGTRACYDGLYIVSIRILPYRRNIMSKGMDSKKSEKKEPAKTMKEKKAEKKIKKAEKK
jgi:hypothetical protein